MSSEEEKEKIKNYLNKDREGIFWNHNDHNNNEWHSDCEFILDWVCWFKHGDEKYYFDSFGVIAPREIVHYLKPPIIYSTCQIQGFNDTNCGQWCLYVLNELNRKRLFSDIVLDLVNAVRRGKKK